MTALADTCDDLWFTRNLIMDRAGYCFGSVLGQSVFDNRDCRGSSVALDPPQAALVRQVQALENQNQCRVDTGRRSLTLRDMEVRRRLIDLPVRDDFESACLGWAGPQTPLYSAHSQAAPVIGQITPGDIVAFGHIPVGNWTYVTVSRGDFVVRSGGWFAGGEGELPCADFAG